LPIQAKYLAQSVGRGIEAIAPETIANYHNGRVAGFVNGRAEHSSTLGFHAEHGEIFGGYKLSEDTLRLGIQVALEGDIERNTGLEGSDAGEQTLLSPMLFDVVVRDRCEISIRLLLNHHQAFGIRCCRELTKNRYGAFLASVGKPEVIPLAR
jgi:hypothetical protein